MLTVLEYLWVRSPEVILRMIEMNVLSNKILTTFPQKKMGLGNTESYAHLMKHDRWRRARCGAIRQVHSYEK
mgnify:FL=1